MLGVETARASVATVEGVRVVAVAGISRRDAEQRSKGPPRQPDAL